MLSLQELILCTVSVAGQSSSGSVVLHAFDCSLHLWHSLCFHINNGKLLHGPNPCNAKRELNPTLLPNYSRNNFHIHLAPILHDLIQLSMNIINA